MHLAAPSAGVCTLVGFTQNRPILLHPAAYIRITSTRPMGSGVTFHNTVNIPILAISFCSGVCYSLHVDNSLRWNAACAICRALARLREWAMRARTAVRARRREFETAYCRFVSSRLGCARASPSENYHYTERDDGLQ